jgi:DNA-binding response OmpR family regulator
MSDILIIGKKNNDLEIIIKVLGYLELYPTVVEDPNNITSLIQEDVCFELILFDVEMYSDNLLAVCNTIKKIDSLKHTPVIFLKTKTDFIDKNFLSGANDYIIKPFSEAELLAKIKTYLHLRALANNKHSKQLRKHIIEYKSKTLKNTVETKTTFQLFEQELDNKNRYIKSLKEKIKKQSIQIYNVENANREIRMENSTLKTSLDKLKKSIAITKLQEDIAKLKKENKMLRDEIAQLNTDLAKADFVDIEEAEEELVKQKVTRWHQRNK